MRNTLFAITTTIRTRKIVAGTIIIIVTITQLLLLSLYTAYPIKPLAIEMIHPLAISRGRMSHQDECVSTLGIPLSKSSEHVSFGVFKWLPFRDVAMQRH